MFKKTKQKQKQNLQKLSLYALFRKKKIEFKIQDFEDKIIHNN